MCLPRGYNYVTCARFRYKIRHYNYWLPRSRAWHQIACSVNSTVHYQGDTRLPPIEYPQTASGWYKHETSNRWSMRSAHCLRERGKIINFNIDFEMIDAWRLSITDLLDEASCTKENETSATWRRVVRIKNGKSQTKKIEDWLWSQKFIRRRRQYCSQILRYVTDPAWVR